MADAEALKAQLIRWQAAQAAQEHRNKLQSKHDLMEKLHQNLDKQTYTDKKEERAALLKKLKLLEEMQKTRQMLDSLAQEEERATSASQVVNATSTVVHDDQRGNDENEQDDDSRRSRQAKPVETASPPTVPPTVARASVRTTATKSKRTLAAAPARATARSKPGAVKPATTRVRFAEPQPHSVDDDQDSDIDDCLVVGKWQRRPKSGVCRTADVITIDDEMQDAAGSSADANEPSASTIARLKALVAATSAARSKAMLTDSSDRPKAGTSNVRRLTLDEGFVSEPSVELFTASHAVAFADDDDDDGASDPGDLVQQKIVRGRGVATWKRTITQSTSTTSEPSIASTLTWHRRRSTGSTPLSDIMAHASKRRRDNLFADEDDEDDGAVKRTKAIIANGRSLRGGFTARQTPSNSAASNDAGIYLPS